MDMDNKKPKTLCKMAKKDFLKNNPGEFLARVGSGEFLCLKCGRVAEEKASLCQPKATAKLKKDEK